MKRSHSLTQLAAGIQTAVEQKLDLLVQPIAKSSGHRSPGAETNPHGTPGHRVREWPEVARG
jgi:hypothetical protein